MIVSQCLHFRRRRLLLCRHQQQSKQRDTTTRMDNMVSDPQQRYEQCNTVGTRSTIPTLIIINKQYIILAMECIQRQFPSPYSPTELFRRKDGVADRLPPKKSQQQHEVSFLIVFYCMDSSDASYVFISNTFHNNNNNNNNNNNKQQQ